MTGMLTLTALLGTLSLSSSPALADTALDSGAVLAFADQDDEEKKDEEEEDDLDYGGDDIDLDVFNDSLDMQEGDEELKRMQEEDALESEEASEQQLDDLDFGGDQEDEFSFEDEYEEQVEIGGPGQDTARIYRTYKENIEDLGPDEEIIQWEQYLEKYPNSLFRDHIQRRVDELTEFQYSERVPDDLDFEGIVDAGRREIQLAMPRHLSSIDPRSKLRGGFEWGFPEYLNLFADYEMQIQRKWSWHVGVVRRYTGWNIEAGTKYALIKSARTDFLLTGLFDIHLNTGPIFPALRPQIGVGKRFALGEGLDVMAVGGVDAELRISEDMALVYIGGVNATFHASEKVAFFLESSITAKELFWDADGQNSSFFRFPLMTFGVTFWAGQKDNVSASIAANAPYAYSYWGYHFGGVMGDFAYWMD